MNAFAERIEVSFAVGVGTILFVLMALGILLPR
jgi:hypothetical protein